ncbi:MAG: DNA polymerase III subunit beta [Candidatus Spechtbacteria bacterium RIFCSPLOWO2_01_FULL_43_12]|uniref:Beta sliding clamp n=1 Tax=Candidatus Spechtbacteria bacterium RIFCSPLOWO2_01_FULL_43_12 TaxID=1802162 RepID=A0A1G2HER9_9BACT|nr:MAG: DNA polymerase III subunit beta [Candidatus Spechtbacteria bacterium RIFCSPLOWO2_01_FULL_43_12]
MKLIIKKHLLLKGIQSVEKNIGRNLTLPVLSNILIRTQKDILNLVSTDLELAVSVSVPAKIEREGNIVVPPKIISSFLNNIPEGNTHIEVKDNNLFIEQGNYKTSIKGEGDREFPLLPKMNKGKHFSIPSSELIKGLQQTINSVAVSDLKPELSGVLFSISKGELKLAATDSFRLSEKRITEKSIETENESMIVPAKTVQEIIRSYQDSSDLLYFYPENNQVIVENADNKNFNLLIISKLIEGDYPDYARIVPNKYETKTIVLKDDFIKQIKAAGLFASRINDVKLSIEARNIKIKTENQDVGKYESSIEASTEGESKETVFNYQYLLEGLGNIEGDEVIIKMNNSDSPAVLESTKNKDYFYIIMPIKGS